MEAVVKGHGKGLIPQPPIAYAETTTSKVYRGQCYKIESPDLSRDKRTVLNWSIVFRAIR